MHEHSHFFVFSPKIYNINQLLILNPATLFICLFALQFQYYRTESSYY